MSPLEVIIWILDIIVLMYHGWRQIIVINNKPYNNSLVCFDFLSSWIRQYNDRNHIDHILIKVLALVLEHCLTGIVNEIVNIEKDAPQLEDCDLNYSAKDAVIVVVRELRLIADRLEATNLAEIH